MKRCFNEFCKMLCLGGGVKTVNSCVNIFSVKCLHIVCCENGFYSVINFVNTTGLYFEIREVHANTKNILFS